MKLFILDRNVTPFEGYGEGHRKIIRAKDEDRAREIANEHVGDEGKIWTDKRQVDCEELTQEGKEELLMCDFYGE